MGRTTFRTTALDLGLQTMGRGPNPGRKAILFGPRSHFF